MTLLKKILDLFGRNTENNSVKDHQAQFKPPINNNTSHTSKAPITFGRFDVIVVGVSFYQKVLEKICGNKCGKGLDVFTQADIIPDNDNPHDNNAVRVEIDGETVGHLSRKNAILWRSKMISDNHSGVVKCPAKIVWDKNYDEEGSYGVWLNLDLSLSDSKPERESAETLSASINQSEDYIEFLVNELNSFELSHCSVGDVVKLWVAHDAKEIFIYRKGGGPGEGKIGICPDELFSDISAAPGCDAKIASIYEGGCKISCRLVSKAEMAERNKQIKAAERKKRQQIRKDLTSPVKYSAIDEDIYKCYISNKTGMCDDIGTWEQFHKIEEQIAQICQERNGKYYKGQTKTARFAIIFDPAARTLSNVTRLREKGYKVTSFEKALDHFGLTDIWECEKLTKTENDYKGVTYKAMFGDMPSKK
jgi:hypothetical protein